MRIVDIIEKKRDFKKLTKEEIEFFIQEYVNGNIKDYQASSLLMAIYLNGMDEEEATNLTYAMLNSGDKLDLSFISGIKVDKHSTGGVGDKTTLILAPLVSSLGCKIAKMSGRGLGHTGGTIDKLESIEGFNVSLSEKDFLNQVNDIGIAVIGQTSEICPADKKLYALRDVTGTVSSIPLIASSIMCKKLASGADVICLDVKVGSGAFMKNIDDARKLASLMVKIGKNLGRKVIAILTDMEEPLGYAVGNNLEVIEAINTLKGNGPSDLNSLVIEFASQLVYNSNLASSINEAKEKVINNLNNNKAYDKFLEFVNAQGGNTNQVLNMDFKAPKNIIEIKSKKSGYVNKLNALDIGLAAMLLGAGRTTKEDSIDMSVGVLLNKKVGDYVLENECLAYAYSNGINEESAINKIFNAYDISNEPVEKKLILDIIC